MTDLTRFCVYDRLDNRRISASKITIKRGDIGFCPYEVSFCLARLPSVERVPMPSEMAAFVYPAKASNLGSTAPSKSWKGRSAGRQGNELLGIGAVSLRG